MSEQKPSGARNTPPRVEVPSLENPQVPIAGAGHKNDFLDELTLHGRLSDLKADLQRLTSAVNSITEAANPLCVGTRFGEKGPTGAALAQVEQMVSGLTAAIQAARSAIDSADGHALALKIIVGATNQRVLALRHHLKLPVGAQATQGIPAATDPPAGTVQ
jgi:hypothetical protein